MVIISDLHIKSKEPYYSSIKQFLNYILEHYPDEDVIQLGDLFDSSTAHSNTIYEIVGILKKFKKIYILQGNHDISRRSGLITEPFKHYDNIVVYDKMTEVEIEGFKCLMLPWIYNAKEIYEQVEWFGDYMFGHVTNIEDQFGDEGINTDKIKAYQVFGHTHTARYINDNKTVMGVQIPSRNGEVPCDFLHVDKTNKKEFISVPKYFEFETIEYGKFPKNKNNILNIKKAPSYQSVYDMYKDYYVRKEGIEILRTENDADIIDKEFESGNIIDRFARYAKEKEVSKEIFECANRYLQEVI